MDDNDNHDFNSRFSDYTIIAVLQISNCNHFTFEILIMRYNDKTATDIKVNRILQSKYFVLFRYYFR